MTRRNNWGEVNNLRKCMYWNRMLNGMPSLLFVCLYRDPDNCVPYFSIGSLALYTTCYVVLMSIGAGLAIPGGLFMPSIVVSQ